MPKTSDPDKNLRAVQLLNKGKTFDEIREVILEEFSSGISYTTLAELKRNLPSQDPKENPISQDSKIVITEPLCNEEGLPYGSTNKVVSVREANQLIEHLRTQIFNMREKINAIQEMKEGVKKVMQLFDKAIEIKAFLKLLSESDLEIIEKVEKVIN